MKSKSNYTVCLFSQITCGGFGVPGAPIDAGFLVYRAAVVHERSELIYDQLKSGRRYTLPVPIRSGNAIPVDWRESPGDCNLNIRFPVKENHLTAFPEAEGMIVGQIPRYCFGDARPPCLAADKHAQRLAYTVTFPPSLPPIGLNY